MSPLSFVLLAMAVSGQAGSVDFSSDLIEVVGDGHHRTIPCEGRAVEVAGVNHVLTFTGECASLEVVGSHNQVTVQLAPGAPLSVAGTNHTVRWRSSGQPRQSIEGVNNRVERLRD
ncbi:DUF3060 domain-containing protein [Brevundimonas sp.]|uniref:DUF3060 domain-containing protein n=1 Tax=Brevundimonas sp. TaxID=1871086 RepID=UPI002FC69BA0